MKKNVLLSSILQEHMHILIPIELIWTEFAIGYLTEANIKHNS